MSYPNAGAIADEISNLYTVKPEAIADIMDNVINSIYGKKMYLKYRHDGIDPITGLFDRKKKEICDCAQKEFGVFGTSGLKKCGICNGSGVVGGWKLEEFRGFFWSKNPSGLKNFSRIFSLTLPIERADGVIYISANESKEKFMNGNFILINYAEENEAENLIEFQIMSNRPIILGEKILWRFLIVTRQPVDQT